MRKPRHGGEKRPLRGVGPNELIAHVKLFDQCLALSALGMCDFLTEARLPRAPRAGCGGFQGFLPWPSLTDNVSGASKRPRFGDFSGEWPYM